MGLKGWHIVEVGVTVSCINGDFKDGIHGDSTLVFGDNIGDLEPEETGLVSWHIVGDGATVSSIHGDFKDGIHKGNGGIVLHGGICADWVHIVALSANGDTKLDNKGIHGAVDCVDTVEGFIESEHIFGDCNICGCVYVGFVLRGEIMEGSVCNGENGCIIGSNIGV